jgi:hypothetical protein
VPEGVCETLLLVGLSANYETVATIISMADDTSYVSAWGMLCQ